MRRRSDVQDDAWSGYKGAAVQILSELAEQKSAMVLMQQELERELNALKAEEASAKKQGDTAEKKRREMERGLAEVAGKRAEAEAEVDRLKREKAAQVSCFHTRSILHAWCTKLRISLESFRSIARPGSKKPSPNLRRKPVTVRVRRLKKRGK